MHEAHDKLRVRVELDKADLESGLRATILDRGSFAVGRVRRRYVGEGDVRVVTRLIVTDLVASTAVPSGNRVPALSSWAVLTVARQGQPKLAEIPEIVQAARSQLVVCVLLHADDAKRIEVLIWDRGQLIAVDEVKLVGSHGFQMGDADEPHEPFDMTAERREFLRTRDSRLLGGLQDILALVRSKRLGVVGAGSGGSSLIRQLGSLKPASLLNIDPDRMGPENLNGMPHASETDACQQVLKVETLALAVESNQPDIPYRGLPWSITEGRTIRYLEDKPIDAWFSFVDNTAARICTGQLARDGFAVHIDVGTRIWFEGNTRHMQADIRLFEPGRGRGCVLCVPDMPADQREAAFYEINAPGDTMLRGEPTEWNDPVQGREGSWLGLNDIAAIQAVNLWKEWLAGHRATSHWLRIHWDFGGEMRMERFDVVGRDGCAICGGGL